jgi:glycosyltransferase involved in cell wall biosynthesis
MKKVLIIGPFPMPVSGVSLANEVISKGLLEKEWKVQTINTEYSNTISQSHGKIDFKKFRIVMTYFQASKILKSNIIYMTIGQTFFGLIKYYPFILISKTFKKQIIVHLHGNHLYNEYLSLSKFKKKIFSHIIKKFNNGIVLSDGLKMNFSPFLKDENIFTLNNFFQDYLKVDKDYLLKTKNFNELNVLFLSNLMEEKGINILLEAVKIVKEKGYNIKVKVAGNKIEENNLDRIFKDADFIEYVGVVDGEEKKNLLYWSTVFCLPTFYKMEGQPISIIEAMATGNLILTTKHAGILDICKEDNAIFVDKKSIESLVDKLIFLSKNKQLIKEKGILNYDYATRKFSESNFIDKANKILEECLN